MSRRVLTFFRGQWLEGNPPLIGPMTHAMWLSSIVFDGARAFEGVAPDLDLHCERVVDSARGLGLSPPLTAGEVLELTRDGLRRFSMDAELYIRPMFFAESGWVDPDPATTQFALAIYESPLPDPSRGFSACLSSRRRPTPETAPTLVKASCHYPQAGLALREAKQAGFDNAVMLDALGMVAELATANLFLGRDGVLHTPAANGSFLNGITRRRVIGLMRADGVTVEERPIRWDEVAEADELFSSGNYGKLLPIRRIGDRELAAGPLFRQARRLYWDHAHGG